jgi:uncharacterized protein (TIGR02996 family)
MFSDEPLFLAILDDPDDPLRRSVYADWLEEHGDPRGDYLCLLLEQHALPQGGPRSAAIVSRLRSLRPSLDRHWVALLHDFDARIREVQTIRLRISTYGSAPKPYNGATMVLRSGAPVLTKLAGWQDAGRKDTGQSYFYLRRPPGARARNPVITVEVPTDAAIEQLAATVRQAGKKTLKMSLDPWEIKYQEKESVKRQSDRIRGAASLEVDLGGYWTVTLDWKAGAESPAWSRVDRYVES